MNDSLNPQAIDSNGGTSATSQTDKLRKQAKQRFMGAAILLLIAVVALPFVLDSKPRIVSSNIAIEIPKMESKMEAKVDIVETKTEIEKLAEPTAPTAAPLVFAEQPPATSVAPVPVAATTTKSKGAFLVQAGSYKEAEKLNAAIAKLNKAGMAHYTQAAQSKDGSPRTRLRLEATFATREEANAAVSKLGKMGITAMVLKS
jgi:DedD protein